MFEGISTETVYSVTRASSYMLVDDPHRQIKTAVIAILGSSNRISMNRISRDLTHHLPPKPLTPPLDTQTTTAMTPHSKLHASSIQTSNQLLKASEINIVKAETSPFPNLALANYYETSRPGLLSIQTPKRVSIKDRSSVHTGTGHPLVSEKLA